MYIPFENLNNESRIWIFQSNRKLNSGEIEKISNDLKDFLSGWATHGKQMNSSFQIVNELQVVVGIDLNIQAASGCSIDALVQKIQQLSGELNIDFFDRKATAVEENGVVNVFSFDQLKEKIASGEIKPSTLIYNNLIQSKGEMQNGWKIKAEESWVKRYFEKVY